MKARASFLSLAIALTLGAAAFAAPIYVPTGGVDFSSLLGGAATPIGVAMTTVFNGDDLSAEVRSQAFGDGQGNYLYLYQISNAGSHVVTRFTLSPFVGADGNVGMGYVTGIQPAGFIIGDQAPLYGDVNDIGPTVGFSFPVGNPVYGVPDSVINAGEISMTLFVQSTLAPGLITGNVINGGVHYGTVVGPVPEPATMALLGLGAVAALRRRRS